ncbi:hypothetical protein C482_13715 [Natrialba chahannaoensis JCM 10990]|uniref:Uncharacterized protein n=1 Tax=Natrialba chahannaoensis JCM 10990 TaxID=1227492 RepID=M0AEW3_9EURY|nr:hypothetical protein [Natrialba chahannaoensis]ELY97295.1 hypothetical protein C482_13715 [Natrialba chahannaoensis JCM 10990]
MIADIKKETDRGFGLQVVDNTGVEHKIGVLHNGEINSHLQDEYPDKAAKRSDEGNEYVEQARRFAQYYVYCEQGYDTMKPRRIHPERINAVRVAIAELTESEFEQHFGDLYRQLRSYDSSTDRVVEIPSAASSPDSVLYRKNVYLGLDPFETEFSEEAEAIATRHGLDLSPDRLDTMSLDDGDTVNLDGWTAASRELGALADAADSDLSDGLQLAGVSSLHMAYLDNRGAEHVTDAAEPFDREPDTRIELPVMDVGSLAEFQDYVNHNLACQVRDAFIRMGLEPPEPFRILGYGDFEAAEQYKRLEMYPNYIDPEEEHAFV